MDSSLKRRGFIKGKLVPLYRAAKTASNVQNNSKVMKPSRSAAATASMGYAVHQQKANFVAEPKPKIWFIVQAADNNRKVNHSDNLFGDEMVDDKAANYIASVKERFKLERTNSE
ncbi:uncharacterized protein LOC123223938 [Mangifera indica]|uniref:uncharacterized protein LOC123223938 n=1 Tax=Mangifera indica TaxID=29780 RepID=UPI001CFB9D28|nr:uncharacterized protein LOC123223938 [Mangifera indica]